MIQRAQQGTVQGNEAQQRQDNCRNGPISQQVGADQQKVSHQHDQHENLRQIQRVQ